MTHQSSHAPFWKTETPLTAASLYVTINYFPRHGKFQLAKKIVDRTTGEERTRNMTLDRRDLQHPAMAQLWRQFLAAAEGSDLLTGK